MTRDALDPGPEGNYPYWPRRPDGTPAGKGLAATTPEEEAAEERMPTGVHRQDGHLVDLTPRFPDGSPIVDVVPDLPPEG
jgi:hypothetical protein